MNITLDGFMSGPDCELDWHFKSWNGEMADVAAEQLSKADTILLGRITYRAMARYWPMQSINILTPRGDIAFADMMNNYAKIVFTKTLKKPEWNNSRIINRDIESEVEQMKKEQGKDMIIYGSGQIVSALMKANLVDEFHIWVHPVIIGKGKTLFRDLTKDLRLELFRTKRFSSGVVLFYYEYQKEFHI
jgi:dihydrofolate reductase